MLPTSIKGLLAVLAVCMPASQSAGNLPENTVVAQCSDDNHNKSNDRIYPGGWNFDIVGIQVSKPDYRPQRSKRAPSGFAFFNGTEGQHRTFVQLLYRGHSGLSSSCMEKRFLVGGNGNRPEELPHDTYKKIPLRPFYPDGFIRPLP